MEETNFQINEEEALQVWVDLAKSHGILGMADRLREHINVSRMTDLQISEDSIVHSTMMVNVFLEQYPKIHEALVEAGRNLFN